jgi:dihydroorotate dehydrogenase electron transfer subunit
MFAKRQESRVRFLEERMACGMGACLVCAVKVRKNGEEIMQHVCKNGPVFNAEEVVFNG